MLLKIGKRFSIEVSSLQEASKEYNNKRNKSGEGASTFPHGKIYDGKKVVGHVSYNGKIWDKATKYFPNLKLLHESVY